MKTLTIREVPDDVYAVICRDARAGHRSIQEQVRLVLTREAQLSSGEDFLKAAEKCRRRFADRRLGPMASTIREERERRCR
jgi:plasmid stability protein